MKVTDELIDGAILEMAKHKPLPIRETVKIILEYGMNSLFPETRPIIREFKGKYRFLSNFWPVKVKGPGGYTYPSVENAYQASKTLNENDWPDFQIITPGKAKKLGKKVEIRADWEDIKVEVMEGLSEQKYAHLDLYNKLMETGDAVLQEGNTWGDKFWGVDLKTGEGKNHLGRLLMKLRDKELLHI